MHPSRALALVAAAMLAACASTPGGSGRTATVQRTTFGVAHIAAPDLETLAYGVAYAHTEDNVCQTAQALVTVRGERSRWFGAAGQGLLGLRALPNEQIDFFVAAHMDDAALDRAWAKTSAESQAMARAWVEGHNRWLADNAARVPAACKGQPWMRPMTLAEYRRLNELSLVQAGVAALADAVLAARPPAPTAAAPAPVEMADAVQAFRETGLTDPPLGSNAWAFGKDSTDNGRGLLLGNPHFPWVGVNRFWQMHLTVPGRLDVMGASIGTTAVVQIGFNKDVAWSHTVSTGKRFTLHELKLVPGDATSYLVDGKPEKMASRTLKIQSKNADGSLAEKTHTLWTSRYGPVLAMPRAGLNWTAATAYAVQDANAGNTRGTETWLGFATAKSVNDMLQAMRNLGIPWVNTIAADRDGRALYADASVVPDVDQAQLDRCAPSKPAAALFASAGIAVLDGSRSDCNWQRDPQSPVPGLTPIERMPVILRSDWVQNSNDSFFWTNPAVRLDNISPMVGDTAIRRSRTRAGLTEIPELLARGKVSLASVQQELFANRSLIARVVLPDLLAACPQAPTPEARDGCAALRQWDGTTNLDAKAAHLFTEFWRSAQGIAGVHRVPFDAARRAATPAGLKMDDAAFAAKVWDALAGAVKRVREAGFALDAPLWAIQVVQSPGGPVAIHGGDEHIGVLNKISALATNGIGANGLVPDHGTSYVQTVTFDERGPVAQALLTYGQSPERDSANAFDQMRLFSRKQWPTLPFHAEDVERERVGPVLQLRRP
ncbi:MAG: penicillin acylase family protein [Rubrivivax sp.]